MTAATKKGLLGILLIIILCGAYCLFSVIHRPLFYNVYGWHPDRGIFPGWQFYPEPVRDDAGNILITDWRKNIVVLLLTGDPHYQGPAIPEQQRGKLIVRGGNDGNTVLDISSVANRLSVVDIRNCRVRSFKIGPGQAKTIWLTMRGGGHDLRDLPKTLENAVLEGATTAPR